MKTKIKSLEEKRIIIDNGYGEIHIAEASDGCFDITVSEAVDNKLRIGIPDDNGTTYMFWKDIKKKMLTPDIGQVEDEVPEEEVLEEEKRVSDGSQKSGKKEKG